MLTEEGPLDPTKAKPRGPWTPPQKMLRLSSVAYYKKPSNSRLRYVSFSLKYSGLMYLRSQKSLIHKFHKKPWKFTRMFKFYRWFSFNRKTKKKNLFKDNLEFIFLGLSKAYFNSLSGVRFRLFNSRELALHLKKNNLKVLQVKHFFKTNLKGFRKKRSEWYYRPSTQYPLKGKGYLSRVPFSIDLKST